ncbi:hypothetical protein BJY00DRAFT_122418 [Aspergillus carlsbadensis]|nr:hypothetical protein BJY00DRAFT_122418 [Aspergillus carlsbadensis]
MTIPPKDSPREPFALHRVDAQKTSVTEIVQLLSYHGGVVVEGLIAEEDLNKVASELRPYFTKTWDHDAMFSQRTRVVCSLPSKSPAFVEKIFGNPLYSEVCDRMLTSHCKLWFGDKDHQCHEFSSPPMYNMSVAFSTLPGNTPQNIHRDDMDHHQRRPAITPEEYTLDRDCIVNMFVAETPTTVENGATRFCPGSHLTETLERPDESQAVPVEMKRGDAFFLLGSAYHAASRNMTKDEERVVYSVFMIRSFLRQTENIYLTLPLEQVKKFSPYLQKRLGFSCGSPICGHIDLKDPRIVLGLPEPSVMQAFYD